MTEGNEFDRLEDELRARTDEEVRQDAAEAAADAELLRRRRRSLTDLFLEAMAQGDRVRLSVAGRWAVAGDLVHVGSDFVTIIDEHTTADVALSAAVARFERATRGGRSSTGGARTLVARLREFEATGESVVVRTSHDNEVRGIVSLVASDHVMIADDDGVQQAIPSPSVVMVVRPFRPR